jgi:hypothetical protein
VIVIESPLVENSPSPSLGKRSKRSHNVKELSVNIPSHNKLLEAQIKYDVNI